MGTNYYLNGYVFSFSDKTYSSVAPLQQEPEDYTDCSSHIGKRSAAGTYCWDCSKTLCVKGEEAIHYTRSGDRWYTTCPVCGKSPDEDNSANAAMVELGFQEANSLRPTGVGSCSSFSWAQPPEDVRRFLHEHAEDSVIMDEYNRKMTGKEFLDMLESNCPIEYTRSVGQDFC